MSLIRKKEMEFLRGEVDAWREDDIITSEQAESILSLYEVRTGNLRLVMMIAGCVLVGLGAASFIAAKWNEIPKIFRVCILAAGYLASLTAYAFTGRSETKTGRAFLLLGSVIFGASIQLITKMYGYELAVSSLFGWWSVQVVITAVVLRDDWQLYLAQIISLVYLNLTDDINFFALQFVNTARISPVEFFAPMNAFVLVTSLWLAWYGIKSRAAMNMNMLITLLLMASRMSLCFGGTITLVVLAVSGAVMSFVSHSRDAEIFGLLMLGLFGLLLTWPEFWRGEMFEAYRDVLSVACAVSSAAVMLVNIYRGHSVTGVTFCAMLASRYFLDNLFGYMPKALGFTLTGIVFMSAGLLFDSIRKK